MATKKPDTTEKKAAAVKIKLRRQAKKDSSTIGSKKYKKPYAGQGR